MQERIEELHGVAVLNRDVRLVLQVLVAQNISEPLLVESVFAALFQNFNFVIGSLLVVAR